LLEKIGKAVELRRNLPVKRDRSNADKWQ